MKFQTKAIHSHQKPDKQTGAVVTPIVTTTTFAIKEPGAPVEYDYSRVSTPTRKTLESCFADLEEAKSCLALSSGCSAMHLILQLLSPGDLVLAEEDLYGGTLRLLKHVEKTQNIRVKHIDFSNLSMVKSMLTNEVKMIWLESPTNPLLKICDILTIAKAKPKEALLVVDSTFSSPYFQRPLDLGADIVIHSATKYIGGHSDCLAGLIVFNKEDLKEKFEFFNKTIGPVLSPFDSYLLLRSLKTLSLRMERHEKNALETAHFLKSNKRVKKVLYPGLPSHSNYEIAKRQMTGFGGVLSFLIEGGQKQAISFLKNLKIFTLAESLGAVESLAEHPLTMTHGSHASSSITEDLIRLSVGLEDIEDIKEDLQQALDKVKF
ncbi:MAG: PLP-dependent aspartate aminotransferase family protein [Bdellovibrionaceae bacterium]|nr:PLP-dependent aspartate aminotransferase family protein [Pseudobdellovibrionaceae bacterium]